MKSWKKRWKQELDEMVPPLPAQTRNAKICNSRRRGIVEWFAVRKKRIFACLASGLAAALCLCLVLPQLLTPIDSSNSSPSNPQTSAPTQSVYTMVAVEINPSVVFCADSRGEVVSVVASNADADVILSDETRLKEMTGKTVERAAEIFVDYAAQLGFLELAQTSAVRVTGCTADTVVSSVRLAIEGYLKWMRQAKISAR